MIGWMSRAALQYIGIGGLGYSFDALDENVTNEYSEAIKVFRYVGSLWAQELMD